MTDDHKPATKKPAAKKASPKAAPKAKPTSPARKPVVLPAVIGTALIVPNLTYRAGQRLYAWFRNR